MSVSDNSHEEAIEAAAIKRFPDTVWSQSATILAFREAFKDGFQAGLLTTSKGETDEQEPTEERLSTLIGVMRFENEGSTGSNNHAIAQAILKRQWTVAARAGDGGMTDTERFKSYGAEEENAYRLAHWDVQRRKLRRFGLEVPAYMLPLPVETKAVSDD